jgi:hypothetical protein
VASGDRRWHGLLSVGLAASLGAAISLGLSEALSDDGSVTGRGGPLRRDAITGVATRLGGMLHTFPFLVPNLGIALKLAYAVVVSELLAIAFIRYRFMGRKLANTIIHVVIGGGGTSGGHHNRGNGGLDSDKTTTKGARSFHRRLTSRCRRAYGGQNSSGISVHLKGARAIAGKNELLTASRNKRRLLVSL